jgi:hypothetical protein
MAFMVRIRSWRTRRQERKDEQLIALGAVSAKDKANAKRTAEGHLNARIGDGPPSHAGEEGKKHH